MRMTKIGVHVYPLLQSTAAILLGFVLIVGLSFGTIEAVRLLGRPLSWGGMYDPGRNLLELAYTSFYAALGGYIAAKLAPRNPMGHALALGVGMLVWYVPHVIFVATTYDTGPLWLPIALMLSALPSAWLGGVVHRRQHGGSPGPRRTEKTQL